MINPDEKGKGMECFRFEVEAQAAGQRLDCYLARQEMKPGLTRSMLQHLIRAGHVLVERQRCKSSCRVQEGDLLEVNLPSPRPSVMMPENIDFPMLYEDDDLAVIAKPPHVVVHPACGNETGTLVHGLLFRCANLSGISGEQRPGIVHRLDKDTSGVMVIAKNDRSHQALSAQFKNRQVEKIYRALVVGRMAAVSGRIDLPLGRHPVQRKKMAVLPAGGREAVTNWRLLEDFTEYSYLEILLETGRTHQIRVHLAYLNHPVVGDSLYSHKKRPNEKLVASRQCLHAYQLSFFHPGSGDRLTFRAPVWSDMEEIITHLRKSAS